MRTGYATRMPADEAPSEQPRKWESPWGLVTLVVLMFLATANGLRHGLSDDGSGWSVGIFWLAIPVLSVVLFVFEARRDSSSRPDRT
jgi:hypothetical protein